MDLLACYRKMNRPPPPPSQLLEREPSGGWGQALPSQVVVGLVLLVVFAAFVGVAAAPLGPGAGGALHLLLEWSAFVAAWLTAVLAVVQFRVQRDVSAPILAAGLAAAGTVDGFQALAASGLLPVGDLDGFLGWSWVLSRCYAVGIVVAGTLMARTSRRAASLLGFGTLGTAVLILAAMSWGLRAATLPPIHQSGWIARPSSAVPLLLLAFAGPLLLRHHRRVRGLFSHALLLSLIPLVAAEVLMASSAAHHDGAFHAAHVLKLVSYLVPFLGLAFAHVRSAQREREAMVELEGARRELLEKTWSLEASLSEQATTLQEARQAEDDAVALAWRLGRSNRELQSFAAVAAHDLQEPLRKLQAFSERFESRFGEQIPEGGRDYLARMNKSAARMHQLVGDLLSFSRVTTQARPFAEVDLDEVVDDVLDDLELRVQETGAVVDVGAMPVIRADALQIRQVLQNLIANALKFRKPDGAPEVRVSAQLLDESKSPIGTRSWQISVADNGIGFDEKYLDRIFEIFQRLHGRQDYEGTGIGLAICRKVVERHGGLLAASSRPGEGATFRLVLPLEPPPPSAAAAEDHMFTPESP